LDIVFGFNPAAVFFLLEFLLQQVRLAFWSHAVLSCHSRRWPEPFSCSRAQIARGPVLLFRFFFVCVCRWFSSILSPAHIWNHQQLMPPSIFSSPVRHLVFLRALPSRTAVRRQVWARDCFSFSCPRACTPAWCCGSTAT
jgi:hypothetical protein